ncbi:energy transducer TonB [Elizabethkingia meningoseptica]|uniref:energy transducer TonB n=1 Tax=Elizabethkingia meningoseptica TaxID=238 RepID=UPI0038913269
MKKYLSVLLVTISIVVFGQEKNIDLNDNNIYEVVDRAADYVSGIGEFRNLFTSNFNNSSVKHEGVMKATLSFIVEKDGSLSDVKASGPNYDFNREAERTIKSIKGKWIPAKVSGVPVRSRFRFPITVTINI